MGCRGRLKPKQYARLYNELKFKNVNYLQNIALVE